jgi:cobalt-zinc-cadmium efflux system protein
MVHNHNTELDPSKHNKLYFALFFTLIFAIVEFIGGAIFNSLALTADAGHMLTDSISLMIAAIASVMAARPASKSYTFGVSKVEVIAAIINLILVSLVIFHILEHVISRIGQPPTIDGMGVIIVATIGLIINIIVFYLLHHGEENLNTKAAKLHVLGDLMGSVAAIISGLMIYFFGLVWFDPLMSIIVCLLLAKMSYGLGKEVFSIILDAVPENISLKEIEDELLKIEDAINIHDIHVWKSANKEISLTAHVDLRTMNNWSGTLEKINKTLQEKFDITHVTIQPEIDFYCEVRIHEKVT